MRRLAVLLATILVLVFTIPAYAAWHIQSSTVFRGSRYIKVKITCISDGNALTAYDLLSNYPDKGLVQGATGYLLKVVPGTGDVIPNTTIDITLGDDEGSTLWSDTTISKDATTWHPLYLSTNGSTVGGPFPPITGKLYLTLNDIGDSGDTITLYLIVWRE